MHRRGAWIIVGSLLLIGIVVVVVARRVSGPGDQDVASRGRAGAAMDRVISVLRIKDQTLETALRTIEREAGVPIEVDWDDLAAIQVGRDTLAVDIHSYGKTVRDALDRLSEGTAFAAESVGDRIVVYNFEASSRRLVVRGHDVADLVHGDALDAVSDPATFGERATYSPDADTGLFALRGLPTDPIELRREKLITLVKETIDPDSWRDNGGSLGDIRYVGDHLLVVHTPWAHADVATLLSAIRARAGDHFSEDVIWPGRWAEDDAMREMLARRSPVDFAFRGATVADALDEIRAAFRANLTVEGARLRSRREIGVNLDARVTLTLKRPTLEEAIRAVFAATLPDADPATAGRLIGFGMEDDELIVADAGSTERLPISRVYDLGPLLPSVASGFDRSFLLLDLRQAVAPESWTREGIAMATVRPASNRFGKNANVFIVAQTRANHRLVRAWLDEKLKSRQFESNGGGK